VERADARLRAGMPALPAKSILIPSSKSVLDTRAANLIARRLLPEPLRYSPEVAEAVNGFAQQNPLRHVPLGRKLFCWADYIVAARNSATACVAARKFQAVFSFTGFLVQK
jgi:hypothetical protein